MKSPSFLVTAACLLVGASSCKQSDSGASTASPSTSAAASAPAPAATPTEAPLGQVPSAAPVGQMMALGDFEGAIGVRTSSAPSALPDMLFLTKGGKLRIDTPAGKSGQVAHTIFDSAANKLTVIMDSQKMALEMPAPAIPAPAPGAASSVTRTGKHETIAGYDCEDWDVTSGARKAAVCVAAGIPFFDFAAVGSRGGSVGGRSWADELREKKGFPLRAIEMDETGKEVSRFEVTKVAKQPLSDDMFAAPKGYTTMNVPSSAGFSTIAGAGHPPGAPGAPSAAPK